jgi:hypothetical protein
MNHGLLTVGSTVDEAGFNFGLLDRGCQIQLQVEAACAGNPMLKKQIISDEEAAYNFKMASDPDSLYAEVQPDLDFIFETDGLEVVSRGVRLWRLIDWGTLCPHICELCHHLAMRRSFTKCPHSNNYAWYQSSLKPIRSCSRLFPNSNLLPY